VTITASDTVPTPGRLSVNAARCHSLRVRFGGKQDVGNLRILGRIRAMIAVPRVPWGSTKVWPPASAMLERREFSTCFVLSCSTTLSCLFLGGGTRSGFLSDALLQFLAVPLLIISLARLLSLSSSGEIKAKETRFALLLCAAVTLVPLLQLIPLPFWVWTSLPNRQPVQSIFDLLGWQKSWQPVSVSPNATWLSFLSLLPPLSIFLAGIQLSYRQRRFITVLVLAAGIVSVFLGLAQVAQGPSSRLRFFNFTNDMEAVGFFANRNHFAALIYTLILFAAAWIIEAARTAGAWRQLKHLDAASILPLIAGFMVLTVLLSCQAMTRSRAGLGLTIIALSGVFCLSFADRRNVSGITPAKLILGSTALAVVFSVQFALYRILDRFATDPLTDGRIAYAHTTITAAKAYMPFGSGIGTFVPIYAMFEQPKDAMIETYVNHAHNDFLELWLEAGVLGIGLIGGFSIWFVRRTIRIWRRRPSEARKIDYSLARSATMTIALLIAHSFVDYPLRTSAMMAIFAFCCALLIEPVSGAASERSPEEEDTTNSKMRRHANKSTRVATTQAGRQDDMTPIPPSPAPGRWGEDIDWPHEWRSGPQGPGGR
jgi:O-antigen ligase